MSDFSPSVTTLAALLIWGTAALAQTPPGSSPDTGGPIWRPVDLQDDGVFKSALATPRPGFDFQTLPLPSTQSFSVPVVSLGKDYRVGPNDLLDIEVLDLDNMKRTVRVNAGGVVSLPLIGAVIVAGLTAQQVESSVAARYREKYLQNPQVSVFIKEFTTERITIDGAVAKPGIYPLTGQFTLLRALALAGGFGQIADSSEVMLFRMGDKGERQVATFNVDQIRAGKSDDPAIKGDDLIVVQRDANRRLLKDSLLRDVLDSINPFSVFSR